jgi:hypothetical protein
MLPWSMPFSLGTLLLVFAGIGTEILDGDDAVL